MIWKKLVVCISDDGLGAAPEWDGNVPQCSEDCRHHDGKRCRATGFRAGGICEPIVREMGRMLDEIDGPSSQ